jgi:hypothetical protein
MSADAIAAFKLARSPSPLAMYMTVYLQANRECYLDYMLGARALANYLQPINVPVVTTTVPLMLRSYELHELAKALAPYTSTPLSTNQIEAAIYDYFILR